MRNCPCKSGAVDEDVETTEFAHKGFGDCREACGVLELQPGKSVIGRGKRFKQSCGARLAPVISDNNGGAESREVAYRGGTDTAATARDQDNSPSQVVLPVHRLKVLPV